MGRSEAISTRVVLGVGALVVAAALWVGWGAIGPEITGVCADPSLRPGDAQWTSVETLPGGYSVEGGVNSSARRWQRVTDGNDWTLTLYHSANTPKGAFSPPGQAAIVRGTEAEVLSAEEWQPGVGPGYQVLWREGSLGCTWYSLQLNGVGVTSAALLVVAADLR